MRLAVEAWQLRQAARQALETGDVQRALALAIDAQGTQSTGSGEALQLLAAHLISGQDPSVRGAHSPARTWRMRSEGGQIS